MPTDAEWTAQVTATMTSFAAIEDERDSLRIQFQQAQDELRSTRALFQMVQSTVTASSQQVQKFKQIAAQVNVLNDNITAQTTNAARIQAVKDLVSYINQVLPE